MSNNPDLTVIACQAKLLNKLRPLAHAFIFLAAFDGQDDIDPDLMAIAHSVSKLFDKDPEIIDKMIEILKK